MTNFEWICKSKENVSALLYQVQDDALEAEGCSLDLKLPACGGWLKWLSMEYTGVISDG